MNREQAKIIGELSDDILEAIEKPEWIKNREFIVAFGEGKDIIFCGIVHLVPSFLDHHAHYSIAEQTQTINGIECPMYLKESDLVMGGGYYLEDITRDIYYCCYLYNVSGLKYLERKIMHLTSENAAKCCKARHGIKE